jgi:hypothetical protein
LNNGFIGLILLLSLLLFAVYVVFRRRSAFLAAVLSYCLVQSVFGPDLVYPSLTFFLLFLTIVHQSMLNRRPTAELERPAPYVQNSTSSSRAMIPSS